MDSPIQQILETRKQGEEYVTRYVMLGGRSETLRMRRAFWYYLERLEFNGYNTEKLVADLGKAYLAHLENGCKHNDLGRALEWWLRWIIDGSNEEKGIYLEKNPDHKYFSSVHSE
ncbi:MAG: hypothetical protein IPP12_15690 [Nitrospira sp.]|nr:hypothetical protein [Nitrospira sp.]